MEVYDEIFDKA